MEYSSKNKKQRLRKGNRGLREDLPHMYYKTEEDREQLMLADPSSIDSEDPAHSTDYRADAGVESPLTRLRKRGAPNRKK